MARWLDRVDDLLYDGETVVEEVRYGDGPTDGVDLGPLSGVTGLDVGPLSIGGGAESGVVVTTHRVLAFTPDSSGKNFEDVGRPNVVGVSRTARGDTQWLLHATKAVVVGLVMVVAGATIDLGGVAGGISLDTTGAAQVGLGGMLDALQTALELLALLDDALRMGGALALVLGVLLMGAYLLTRERVLSVEVAGDDEDDLVLPAPEESGVVDRLQRALDAPTPESGTASADGDPDRGRRA